VKRFVVFLLAFLVFSNVFSQALPVTRMQNAVSGSIEQKLAKRGFAANDPRFGATLDLVSNGLAGVAGTTAAAVVAGAITAPAWATVAIAAGVGTVVTVGVTLAINGIYNWLFSPDPKDTTPITTHQNQAAPPTGGALVAGGPYWVSSVLGIIGADAMSVINSALPMNWPADSSSTYQLGTCTSTVATRVSCSVDRVSKSTGYVQKNYAGLSADYNASGAPGSCQIGMVRYGGTCVVVPTAVVPDAKTSAQQAINNLPSSELVKPLNPAIIATIADKAWRDAAAQPGYNGIPYSATDPITTSEVDAWRQANPGSWPTVQDFVDPQPASNSPWKLPASPTATTQSPSAATTPSTNPASSNPLENLGPDPGIGSPSLEPTPTAQQILKPLLDLFPDFRNFVVPSHQGICPKPTFDVFDKQLVMDAQCTISEEHRDSLFSVMAAVWALTAVFIVLKA
jgi:hypothetical protein